MPEKIGLAGVFSGCSLLFLLTRWLKKRSNVLAADPAAVDLRSCTTLSFPRVADRQGWRAACEAGLGLCLFVLPAMLALVPRGAAPLAAVAGLCAIGDPSRPIQPCALGAGCGFRRRYSGLLLLWGGLSALWAIEPARSLMKDMQLAGLFAAAIVLAAAARSIADPRRLAVLTIAGTALGLVVAWSDFGTSGGLSHYVTVRPFAPPRLNQIAVWLAIMLLPIAAFCGGSGRDLLGIAAAFAIGATVFLLEGTAAKTALLLSLPVAALLYWRRRRCRRGSRRR